VKWWVRLPHPAPGVTKNIMEIISPTFRQSVYDIIDALRNHGVEKKVFDDFQSKEKAMIYGGTGCLEISPLLNIIEDSLQLFPTIPGRGNHFTMQLAELIWVLKGKANISEFFGQFASPTVQQFSHNTDDLYAAYGYRIRNYPRGNDVLKYVINTLTEKITSRSAVIPLFNAELDTKGGEHKPCATTFQLHYYDNKLDGILTLRANDLIKGYSAINFLEFAFIQSIVAYCVGCDVGRFVNFTATMHYYTGDATKRIERINNFRNLIVPAEKIKLKDLFNYNVNLEKRYETVLNDVDIIYDILKKSNQSISDVKLTHPIFNNIFQILKGVKFGIPLRDVVRLLPDYLISPFLENQYKNKKDEVIKILGEYKKFDKYKDALTWRD
jgi:thymidylate synthase